MKTVNEVLGNVKGEDRINDILTGKGSFSKQGFSDTVSALANDTTFKLKTYDSNGQVTGEVSVSELIREDLKKTLDKAKYPQKSEAGVLDNTEIVTDGLAKAIPLIVMEQLKCGKKFDLPTQPNVNGSIYLAPVTGTTKTVQVRDIKTKQPLGTSTITTKDSVTIKAKSPVPNHLQTKVKKDLKGNVVKDFPRN